MFSLVGYSKLLFITRRKNSELNIFKKQTKFFNNLAMKKICALTCTPI